MKILHLFAGNDAIVIGIDKFQKRLGEVLMAFVRSNLRTSASRINKTKV